MSACSDLALHRHAGLLRAAYVLRSHGNDHFKDVTPEERTCVMMRPTLAARKVESIPTAVGLSFDEPKVGADLVRATWRWRRRSVPCTHKAPK